MVRQLSTLQTAMEPSTSGSSCLRLGSSLSKDRASTCKHGQTPRMARNDLFPNGLGGSRSRRMPAAAVRLRLVRRILDL